MPQVNVSDELWARVKAYARPLEDTFESVISRALDALDKTAGSRTVTITAPRPTVATFKTIRGEHLPIGLEMFADWNGHKLKAKVTESGIEYAGKPYAGPSPAARAAMKAHGATDTQASVNGWTFWMMKSPGLQNRICAIDYYRQKK